MGNASVRALGSELGMTLDRRRFRANLYADWRAGQPYRENDLVGRTLAIGERVRIAILERDPRCQMITIDPATAQTDRCILRHVNEAHGTTFGVYRGGAGGGRGTEGGWDLDGVTRHLKLQRRRLIAIVPV